MSQKSLYIIDGHALIYSAYYAPMRQNLVSPSGIPTKAVFIVANTLLGFIERKKPDMLVVAMDSKADSFRKEIYPEYKAHRPPMPEDMPIQIDYIEKILESMKIPMLRVGGFEADDLIGTLSKKGEEHGYKVYICSKDKDMLQLLSENIVTYDIKKDEVHDVDWLKNEMGITPEQFIDVLALQGDKADNIPGVPDVGPKTALQWIVEYGDIDSLYANSDKIKGKRGQALRDNREMVDLSKELVIINCESPVDIDEKEFVLKDYDKESLSSVFGELGFSKLLQQIGAKAAEKQTPKKSSGQLSLFGDSSEKTEDSTAPAVSGLLDLKTAENDYKLIDTNEKLEDFASLLAKQTIFAIDTETTSLNAVDADLVGVNVSWKKGEAYYIPLKAPLGYATVSSSKFRDIFTPVLADDKVKKVGQNLKYDLLVLEGAGFEVKGVHFDTMIASYILHADRNSNSMDAMARDYLGYECMPITELIGKGKKQKTFDEVDTALACDYACEDADITWQLYEYLTKELEKEPELEQLFNEVEMPLMHVLFRMESNGVSLDVKILKKMSQEIAEKLDSISDKIHELAGEMFNLDSPKQLSEILFDKLGLDEVKKRSTDIAVLEELKETHEIIPQIIEYRQLAKLKNTYLDKLPAMISVRTNKLHASFNQTVAATGRLSSSDPNLQNIPIRTDIGRKIRSAFVPEKSDYSILSADYSQVELRLLAHLSGDQELKKAFENDMDIHSFVASQIFDIDIKDVDSDMRARCKAVNFGVIYGQGAFGLSKTIGIPQREAKRFIDDYFSKYKSIKDYMHSVIETAKKSGYAETILGRRRAVYGLDSKNFNVRSQAERMAFNTVIQGSAADLIKQAMINIEQKIENESLPIKMILQIHDELVFEVPDKNSDEYKDIVQTMMSGAIKLDVPLKVDVGLGKSWMTGH